MKIQISGGLGQILKNLGRENDSNSKKGEGGAARKTEDSLARLKRVDCEDTNRDANGHMKIPHTQCLPVLSFPAEYQKQARYFFQCSRAFQKLNMP